MSELPDRAQPPATAAEQPYGEVFDRGYRRYDGRREGRRHAISALVVYSLKRGFGIKKRWTAKIIPLALYAVSFLPVIVFIALRAILGPLADVSGFDYFGVYQMLSLVLLVFAAGMAPEMLCDDRRQHVLQIYFSRAIDRADYLLAKIGALALLVGSIAFLPALLLFAGNMFLAPGPFEYLRDHADDLGRIVAAGALIGLFYTSIALVVAAHIDRKGIAAATFVGGVLVVSAVAGAVFSTAPADWQRYIVLANPGLVPQGALVWLFDAKAMSGADLQIIQADLPGVWYVLATLLLTLVCAAIMYRRYLLEERFGHD